MEILLIGYMGSGKSTVGNYISKEINLEFIDLDKYIEEKEGLSIKEIFSAKGEIYFRLQEATYLKEILESKSDYVLSLGGGTPCYANNIKTIIESNIESFYLKATIPTLIKRLEKEKESRPLIADLEEHQMVEYIGKHLFERAPFYEQSKFKISIDNKTTKEICSEITTQLH